MTTPIPTREDLLPFPESIDGTPSQWLELARIYRDSKYVRAGICIIAFNEFGMNIFHMMNEWICKVHPDDYSYWFNFSYIENNLQRAAVCNLIAKELIERAKTRKLAP